MKPHNYIALRLRALGAAGSASWIFCITQSSRLAAAVRDLATRRRSEADFFETLSLRPLTGRQT